MAVIPVLPGVPIKLSAIAEIAKPNLPASNLTAGETLTVSIVDKLSQNQYLMYVKGTVMKAASDLPFNVGEKLQVKVQGVQPQIILYMLDAQKQGSDAKVNEKLLQWRLNPDSLTQLLSKISEFSVNLKSVNLAGLLPKDADGLVKLFTSLVFSSRTKNDPLYVKNFVSKSGMLLENDLSRMSSGSGKDGPAAPPHSDNLKASLLKLSEIVAQALRADPKSDPQVAAKLLHLASFASEALQTIEARQAVNVVYQQNESGLYLQIPLALGDSLRQADIFISPDDKNAAGAKKFSSCSIMIFLDLDYLGNLSIDASLKAGHIRCVIKCESEEIAQLVNASAPKLKDALGAIGYGVEQVDCLKVSELERQRTEFINEHLLGSTDLVNHFV